MPSDECVWYRSIRTTWCRTYVCSGCMFFLQKEEEEDEEEDVVG